MKHLTASLYLAVLVPLCLGASNSPEFPEYHAASPGSSPVTAQNLLASERFWPYQVSLVRTWKPAGQEKPLASGSTGVLIRVESSGEARVDFGRDGLFTLPAEATDLVERANDVRTGKLQKLAANFVLAIGPRLLDARADPPRGVRISETAERAAFLTVFATREQLPGLAPGLAPLDGRHGMMTIVLAQGSYPDARLYEDLRRLGWKVPFVADYLADAYLASLLPEGMKLPAVMLQTPEGRVLFQSTWGPGVAAKLTAAIDAGFAAGAAK